MLVLVLSGVSVPYHGRLFTMTCTWRMRCAESRPFKAVNRRAADYEVTTANGYEVAAANGYEVKAANGYEANIQLMLVYDQS